jgi:hypothetical protein
MLIRLGTSSSDAAALWVIVAAEEGEKEKGLSSFLHHPFA